MRHLCDLNSQDDAERLTSYLMTQQIAAMADQESEDSWSIWVLDEDNVDQARDELASFQQDPSNDRYSQAVDEARRLMKEKTVEREQAAKRQVEMRGQWREPGSTQRKAITTTLFLASLLVCLMTNFGEDKSSTAMRALEFVDIHALKERVAMGEPVDKYHDLKQGQIWRVVTPIFLHFGIWHFAFNMLWLFQLGGVLESRYGSPRFLALAMVTGIAGVLLQCCLPAEVGGGFAGGGMSGVVYGLLGFAWVKTRYDSDSGLYLRGDIFVFMLAWLALGFLGVLETMFGMNVANWAHAGGLAAGMLLAFWSLRRSS